MSDLFNQEHHRTEQHIFADIDETIVSIRPKLASLFFTDDTINRPEYHKYFNKAMLDLWEQGPDKISEFIVHANSYYIEKEILTPEGVDFFNNKHKSVGLYLYDKYQDNFYDDLELSFIGEFLKFHSTTVDNLIFMTHHNETASKDSKGRFIAKHFPDSDIVFIPIDIKKSKMLNDVVKELDVQPTAFIDDRPDVIVDILTNTKFDIGFQLGLVAHNYTNFFKDQHGIPLINNIGLVSQYKRYVFKTYAPDKRYDLSV